MCWLTILKISCRSRCSRKRNLIPIPAVRPGPAVLARIHTTSPRPRTAVLSSSCSSNRTRLPWGRVLATWMNMPPIEMFSHSPSTTSIESSNCSLMAFPTGARVALRWAVGSWS